MKSRILFWIFMVLVAIALLVGHSMQFYYRMKCDLSVHRSQECVFTDGLRPNQ